MPGVNSILSCGLKKTAKADVPVHDGRVDLSGDRRGADIDGTVGDRPSVLPVPKTPAKRAWGGAWQGADVVVMASGPSLTAEDIETVRQWREAGENRYVIVTNTTYQSALWADALFFYDFKWWKRYEQDVAANFAGHRVTISSASGSSVTRLQSPHFNGFGNSGAGAISLAVLAEARRVILLGLDCKYGKGGKRHHFGNHPPGLGNALSLKKWPNSFKRLAGHAKNKGVEVINASRDTALTCFPRVSLEEAL